jgi:hypothetical protein
LARAAERATSGEERPARTTKLQPKPKAYKKEASRVVKKEEKYEPSESDRAPGEIEEDSEFMDDEGVEAEARDPSPAIAKLVRLVSRRDSSAKQSAAHTGRAFLGLCDGIAGRC